MSAVVVLAGGKSRRMGRDKLSMVYDGRTLLESAVQRFKSEFSDVYISVSDEGKYPNIDAQRIVDIIPGVGPLSGLHAALKTIKNDSVFLVAADLPFADPLAAKRIIALGSGFEACVIKLPDGNVEPLFGYYARTLLPLCEELIASGDNRMTGIYVGTNTRFVSPSELGDAWDDKMIININYPKDYEAIRDVKL